MEGCSEQFCHLVTCFKYDGVKKKKISKKMHCIACAKASIPWWECSMDWIAIEGGTQLWH